MACCFAYNQVADGYEDDERKRIQVRQDVVGQTVRVHSGSLRGQIVVQLVVAEPFLHVKRDAHEMKKKARVQ